MHIQTRLQLATPSDREIVITRQFDAPRHLVFAAFTRPELIRKWLGVMPGWSMINCQFDARVGGTYRYVLAGPGGQELAFGGTLLELVPPERMVARELYDQDWTGGETTVTLELEEKGGVTTLTQTVLYSSREARDGAKMSGMAEGMGLGFLAMDALLAEEQGRDT